MRYFIVQTIGTGSDTDKIRAPFPTYELLHVTPTGKALIRVLDDDALDDDGQPIVAGVIQKLSVWLTARGVPAPRIAEAVERWGDPDVTLAVAPAALVKWRRRIKAKYRERAAEYDFDIG